MHKKHIGREFLSKMSGIIVDFEFLISSVLINKLSEILVVFAVMIISESKKLTLLYSRNQNLS